MKRLLAITVIASMACSGRPATPKTERVVIDRFSDAAGHLMKRSKQPSLPGPDQPIDFDRPPFITRGLGPDGKSVRYYNFDVQPDVPAVLYRPTRGGKSIANQPDLVDVIPGDTGYSDFWRVVTVEVPDGVELTSVAQLARFAATATSTVIDCPIVPRGSTARTAIGVTPPRFRELVYRGTRIMCLEFSPSLVLDNDRVPTSPIYVTFASEGRFRTESDRPVQTHNVVFSVPGDTDYSPLWAVHVYDRAAFDSVRDANSALAAPGIVKGPLVNCPIVAVGE